MHLYAVLSSRVALLLASSVSSQLAFTSPTAPPPAEEQAKYKAAPPVGESGFTVVHAASTVKHAVHILNLIDLISLLSSAGFRVAHQLPSYLTVELDIHTIPPSVLVGTLFMCLGTALRVVSYQYLGRYFTFQLAIKKDHKLVTSGPYSVVRHPSYTGAVVYMLGVAVSMLGPGSVYAELGLWENTFACAAGLCLFAMLSYISLGVALRMPKEDLALRTEFKEQWVEWARRTPCRLFPGIY